MKYKDNKICYTNEKLKEIIEKHKKWLNYKKDGEKANLQGADLWSADLQGADLRRADLRSADLQGADLRNADLWRADLQSADLQGADLRGADLQGANLDFSCLPLWRGSLLANMDDRQVKQLLYHILSIVKHSNNVSETIKAALLTDKNIEIAKEFHRANKCNKL